MEDITYTEFIQSIKALITFSIIKKIVYKNYNKIKLYSITMTSVKTLKLHLSISITLRRIKALGQHDHHST